MAKGSIVSPRNRATWLRASLVAPAKNRVPARAIATAVSPAELVECRWIRRESPDCLAPWASAARRA